MTVQGKPDAMVAAWEVSVHQIRQVLRLSIRPSRYTYRNLMDRKAFKVSIPSVHYSAEADFFGITSGGDTDKFAITGLTPQRAELVDAPSVQNSRSCSNAALPSM